MISQDGLGLDYRAGAMAVSPDGTRAYLGQYASNDRDRMNLLVVSLDPSLGKRVGEPRLYADSTIPLPFGDRAEVDRILVDATNKKLYLISNVLLNGGYIESDLTVYDLDSNWDPIAVPGPDNTLVPSVASVAVYNPANGALATIANGLALDPQLNMLYVVADHDPNVYVYDLSGLPGAALPQPHAYPISNIGAFDVAVGGNHLYVAAPNNVYQASIEVVTLSSGIPQVGSGQYYTVPNSYPFFDFAYTPHAIYGRQDIPYELSAYQATSAPPNRPLWVLQLGADGNPVGGAQPLTQFGSQTAVMGSADAVDVSPSGNTLWVATQDTFQDAFTGKTVVDGTKLVAIPLDTNPMDTNFGLPAGPGVDSAIAYYAPGSLLMAIDSDHSPVMLTPDSNSITGSQVKDYWLQVTVTQANDASGNSLGPLPVWLYSNSTFLGQLYAQGGTNTTPVNSPVPVNVGDPVDVSLDQFFHSSSSAPIPLQNVVGQRAIFVGIGNYLSPPPIALLTMRLEVWQGNPDAVGSTLLTPPEGLTETVQGENVVLLVPGYGFLPPGQRPGEFETMSQHAQKYLTAAQQIALNPEDRPNNFVISAHGVLGGEANQQMLKAEAAALSELGINTVEPDLFRGFSGNIGLDPVTIDKDLDANGLQGRQLTTNFPDYNAYSTPDPNEAVYLPQPPALFDIPLMQPIAPNDKTTVLQRWVQQLVDRAKNEFGGVANVTAIAMHDEPTWYYPQMVNEVIAANGSTVNGVTLPDWLGAFQSYLMKTGSEQGLTATDFDPNIGPNDWNRLMPIGASNALTANAPIETKRLFYWTMRYFEDSNAQGVNLARKALLEEFPNLRNVYLDWGGENWLSLWYDNLNSTPPATPNDNAVGSNDWLESGRMNSSSPWTETGYNQPDQQAEQISTVSDILRSASMLTTPDSGVLGAPEPWQDFGMNLDGTKFGGFPSGASYKILSLLGHGAKAVNLPSFGPAPLTTLDSWSELNDVSNPTNLTNVYGPIAQALRLVARAEPVLYPGRPDRGKVAVLLPSSSNLWEADSATPLYESTQELFGLDYALVHAGYTVDFVDDTDLANGALADRGYTTLYLTGPNVSTAAQQQVKDWVARGGTLVVTPGAATADEYNTPTNILDSVLGLQPRQPIRGRLNDLAGTDAVTLVGDSTAAVFGTGTMNLYGQGYALSPLPSGGATVEGTLNPIRQSGNTTQDSNLVTGLTTSHLNIGVPVSGPGIPDNTTIASIVNDSEITLSANATASGTSILTFVARGITVNYSGKGTAIAYGFFPGIQYWMSASESLGTYTDLPRLPQRWGQVQRQMANAPAVLANTPKPVTVSQEVVEADLLHSDKGIAITVLNWTDQPISNLKVTVPNVGAFTTVCTANGVPVQTQLVGDTMQITLPLDQVDVLLLQDSGATATIDGTQGNDQFVITPTGVELNGQTVVSGPYGSLTLNGLGGDDTFTVLGTPAGSQVTLNCGTGNDRFNVGSTTNGLDPIQGTVTVNGQGANTMLNVNDQGSSSPETYQLFGTQLLRYPSPPAGQPLGNPTQTINYFNVNHVYVHGGTASDSWLVDSTLAGTTTDLYSAGGSFSTANEFIVHNSALVLDGIQGPLGVHGGGVYDFVEAYDGSNAVGHTYTLTTRELQRDGMANLTYDGLGEFVLYAANNPYVGHTPSNTINVQSLGNISAAIAAATGDTVTIGQNGTLAGILGDLRIQAGGSSRAQGLIKQVIIDDSADPNPRTVDLESNATFGYLIAGLANTSQGMGRIGLLLDPAAPVSILGGPADDVFRIHNFTGAPAISINAKPARSTRTNMHNKLDYSAYTGTVQVILPLGKATGFAKVSGIQDVAGGIGNNLLVGDANLNILIGGRGRNVLIGGAGADTLDAHLSTGDNILIGGRTHYDSNLAALDAIFAEWTRTDLRPNNSFQIRYNDLLSGTGSANPLNKVNGRLILLTPATNKTSSNGTVHADSSPDTLIGSNRIDPATGKRVHNWFFYDSDDMIVNFMKPHDRKHKVT